MATRVRLQDKKTGDLAVVYSVDAKELIALDPDRWSTVGVENERPAAEITPPPKPPTPDQPIADAGVLAAPSSRPDSPSFSGSVRGRR